MENVFVTYLPSPIGTLEIKGNEDGISSVLFVMDEGISSNHIPDCLQQCSEELKEYFSGDRKEFTVKLAPQGTDFQLRVWRQLQIIPYGLTTTYGSISKKLKLGENAARAVGHANGQNPIVLIIPCHRVIGVGGKLTGYGGGLWRKEWLLNYEGKNAGTRPNLF